MLRGDVGDLLFPVTVRNRFCEQTLFILALKGSVSLELGPGASSIRW